MKKIIVLGLAILMVLSGCFSTPAREVTNICNLLDEKVSWYQAVKESEKKWGAPMHLQLAIIYQESHFASNAKPPRNKIFGIIPGARPTTSFGFTQAKKATWDWYQLKTGNKSAKRNNFADAVDFVGWYINQSDLRSKISKQMPTTSIWLIMKVMVVITIRLMKIRPGSLILLKKLKRSLIPTRANFLNAEINLIIIVFGRSFN